MPYGKRSSRLCPHDAVSSSRVPSVAREHRVPCRPTLPEPEDGEEMAQPNHDSRCADGPPGAQEHGADAGRGSHRGDVPAEDTAAAGRRAGLPEGHHPQPQPQCLASLPPTSWLPVEETKEQCKRFKTYEIGYVHIDSGERPDRSTSPRTGVKPIRRPSNTGAKRRARCSKKGEV
jgi:hypothetical protein